MSSHRVEIDGPAFDPIEAARRLAGLPGRFLLDSASDADGGGRWCFVGAEPSRVVRGRVDDLGAKGRDPFAEVAALAEGEEAAGEGPVPLAVGYLGYDLGRLVERIPSRAAEDARTDDVWFGRYEAVWRYDRRTGRGCVVGEERAARALRERLMQGTPSASRGLMQGTPSASRGLMQGTPSASRGLIQGTPSASRGWVGTYHVPPTFAPLTPDEGADRHLAAIERALAYIRAGDVYQVNLARRLSAAILTPGDPLALYERIARVSPAPFGALLEHDGATVISDSPELFLRRRAGERRVETRPIKGTRRRGHDPDEDAALAAALAADDKERAEHLMIVDLERNDLGRVAEIGSVVVEGFARVVTLPTVHHLVSTVACELRAGATIADVLRATFPGGSITGAPKVRAMEIIDELEPVRRGPYTGAIGFLGAGGAIELSIVIRTAVLAAGALTLHVGGGIVADSRPERELEETEEKAEAWRRALATLNEVA